MTMPAASEVETVIDWLVRHSVPAGRAFSPHQRARRPNWRPREAHSAVSVRNRDLVGKGLSIQAYHIAEGIVEIDRFLRAETPPDDGRRETVAEAHPELCFTTIAGQPLEYPKTTAAGLGERLDTLEAVLLEPASVFQSACTDLASTAAAPDDVLDAICLAATATAPDDQRQRLPQDPPTDAEGLPMQMLYRADEPLER